MTKKLKTRSTLLLTSSFLATFLLIAPICTEFVRQIITA